MSPERANLSWQEEAVLPSPAASPLPRATSRSAACAPDLVPACSHSQRTIAVGGCAVVTVGALFAYRLAGSAGTRAGGSQVWPLAARQNSFRAGKLLATDSTKQEEIRWEPRRWPGPRAALLQDRHNHALKERAVAGGDAAP